MSGAGDGPIGQIFPTAVAALDDDALLALLAPADRAVPRLRANFVASIDGSATAEGLSGSLGGPADRTVFDLMRQLCDVIVVAAGTVAAEGYAGPLVPAAASAWRVANGLAPHPAVAVVTGRLSPDPESDFFTQSPVRPLVLTTASADAGRRRALSEVADVIDCGSATVEPGLIVESLVARGLKQMHCEGGPSLLGALIEADVLDALCLTISPSLEGGSGPRIAVRPGEAAPIDLRAMRLDHVLHASGMLLTQYTRVR